MDNLPLAKYLKRNNLECGNKYFLDYNKVIFLNILLSN